MRSVALAVALIAGCSSDIPVLEPIIDVPPATSDAFPYGGLDEILVSVARAGEEVSLQEALVGVGEPLALSEIPFGDDLVVHISGRSGGFEIAYGRTCPFSMSADAAPAPNEPHLYLSRIVKWGTSSAPTEMTRIAGSAYALPDGRAVFLGGGRAIQAIERFDPQTGAFTTIGTDLVARQGQVIAPFNDGRVLIVGGVDGNDNAIPTVEVVDPRPGVAAGAQRDQQDGPRLRGHAAATLVDDSVLIIGGRTQADINQPFTVSNVAYRFRFGAGNVLEPAEQLVATLRLPRADHTVTRLGDELGADVIVIGGRDELGNPVPETELFRPLSESFEDLSMGDLNTPRWGHASVRLPGGFILVVGGFKPPTGGDEPLPVVDLELYDPIQGRFTPAGTLPAGAGLTELTVTELPDGRSLLAGGRDLNGQPVSTVLIARLDPVDGQVDVSATDSLQVPRAGHSAVRLCDGTILITGGAAEPGEHGSERYNPPPEGRR